MTTPIKNGTPVPNGTLVPRKKITKKKELIPQRYESYLDQLLQCQCRVALDLEGNLNLVSDDIKETTRHSHKFTLIKFEQSILLKTQLAKTLKRADQLANCFLFINNHYLFKEQPNYVKRYQETLEGEMQYYNTEGNLVDRSESLKKMIEDYNVEKAKLEASKPDLDNFIKNLQIQITKVNNYFIDLKQHQLNSFNKNNNLSIISSSYLILSTQKSTFCNQEQTVRKLNAKLIILANHIGKRLAFYGTNELQNADLIEKFKKIFEKVKNLNNFFEELKKGYEKYHTRFGLIENSTLKSSKYFFLNF